MGYPAVAVALSGGIDSLVSGFLIKKQYPKVFGIHFTTGYEKKELSLKGLEDQLGFDIIRLDLSRLFEQQVVDYFVSTYLSGQTPNPCLICNQKIKFGALLEEAGKQGADFLATGHYATVVNSASFPEKSITYPWLEKGTDTLKDQSYFLARLLPDQLDKIIFPLAPYTKQKTIQIARDNGLVPLTAKDSQDICFIHQRSFFDFIQEKTGICPSPGEIKDIKGRVIGTHQGLHAFTVGQRRGINCPASEPYYVKAVDPLTNTLFVGFKKDLFENQMQVNQVLWNGPGIGSPPKQARVMTKIRYGHKAALSRLALDDTKPQNIWGRVLFDCPQTAVTPGQAAVFYDGDRVLGSGIIK